MSKHLLCDFPSKGSLVGACRPLSHHERLHAAALGHIEAWLDYDIIYYLEDIRDHVQLPLYLWHYLLVTPTRIRVKMRV